MMIFKIERERPAFTVHQNLMFYVKDRQLRRLDFTTTKDVPLIQLRAMKASPAYSMEYNPAEHAVLITYRTPQNLENSMYDLYQLPKDVCKFYSRVNLF